MKQKIDRVKKSVMSNRYRTIAVTLCFVLMLSAICAGGVFSAVVAGGDKSIDSNSITQTGSINTANPNAEIIDVDLDADGEEGTLSKKGDSDLAATGATYYLLLSYNSNNPSNMTRYVSSGSATFTVSPSSFGKTSWETGVNYYVGISSSTSYTNMYSQGGSSTTGTVSGSITAGNQNYNIGSTKYNFAYFTVTNTTAVNNVTVSVAGGANTTYSFSASSNIYNISYNTPTNGSFTSAPATGIAGSTITVKVSPNTGYRCTGITYNDGSTRNATLSSTNTYTFTMPSNNVTAVTATFEQLSYTITCSEREGIYTVSDLESSAHYGDTVSFTVTPDYAEYEITSVTTTPSLTVTKSGTTYSFTMPASNVSVRVHFRATSSYINVYFKSATAYVYHPFITVNGGSEVEMELQDNMLLTNPKTHTDNPYSETGSLRYGWYKATIDNVDTTSPVEFVIRGKDTYMNATGTFTVGSDGNIYLACDNLMEGKTLVDLTSESDTVKNFYDTPLNMIE